MKSNQNSKQINTKGKGHTIDINITHDDGQAMGESLRDVQMSR